MRTDTLYVPMKKREAYGAFTVFACIIDGMNKEYVEVWLRTAVDAGEILALMENEDGLGAWERDGTVHLFWPAERWTPVTLGELRRALAVLGIEEREAELAVERIPDKDWNEVWAESLTPIRLGRRFRIRQSWHEPDPAFNGIELVIDPKRAFGTGYHATTRLVLEWLEAHVHGGEKVLDVGTGSGVLSMAALRLGAVSALGIDNDAIAIECAQEYARTNGFGSELELRLATFEECLGDRYDILVANIDGKTLPLLCPYLGRLLTEAGTGCFSGLQEQDRDEINEALETAGFIVSTRQKSGEWLALTIARKTGE